MKIVLTNDSNRPAYVKFESGADLNMNPNTSTELEATEGAEMFFKADYIETKNIQRP